MTRVFQLTIVLVLLVSPYIQARYITMSHNTLSSISALTTLTVHPESLLTEQPSETSAVHTVQGIAVSVHAPKARRGKGGPQKPGETFQAYQTRIAEYRAEQSRAKAERRARAKQVLSERATAIIADIHAQAVSPLSTAWERTETSKLDELDIRTTAVGQAVADVLAGTADADADVRRLLRNRYSSSKRASTRVQIAEELIAKFKPASRCIGKVKAWDTQRLASVLREETFRGMPVSERAKSWNYGTFDPMRDYVHTTAGNRLHSVLRASIRNVGLIPDGKSVFTQTERLAPKPDVVRHNMNPINYLRTESWTDTRGGKSRGDKADRIARVCPSLWTKHVLEIIGKDGEPYECTILENKVTGNFYTLRPEPELTPTKPAGYLWIKDPAIKGQRCYLRADVLGPFTHWNGPDTRHAGEQVTTGSGFPSKDAMREYLYRADGCKHVNGRTRKSDTARWDERLQEYVVPEDRERVSVDGYKTRDNTVTLHASYALARSEQGYVYSVYPRPTATRVQTL